MLTYRIEARRQKLKEWIQPFSPVQLQEKAFDKRKGMASTGRWLLEGKFKDWMKGSEGTARILWLRGKCTSAILDAPNDLC